MSKRPKFNFQALIQNDVAPAMSPVAPQPAEQAPPALSIVAAPPRTARSTPAQREGTLKQRARQQSLYLEVPVHEALREIAFHERTSLHALFLEGVDAVLKKRGSPSIKELLSIKRKAVL